MACYKGPNPIKDEERATIWKWAKEKGIDRGMSYDKVHDAINEYFYAGQARPEWITDILSGRKTPFRKTAEELWKKQYNRSAIVQHAKMLSQQGSLGPIGRFVQRMR